MPADDHLAIKGGEPIRTAPWPARSWLTVEELADFYDRASFIMPGMPTGGELLGGPVQDLVLDHSSCVPSMGKSPARGFPSAPARWGQRRTSASCRPVSVKRYTWGSVRSR